MRLCHDGEISSSVVFIIITITYLFTHTTGIAHFRIIRKLVRYSFCVLKFMTARSTNLAELSGPAVLCIFARSLNQNSLTSLHGHEF